MSLRWRGDRLNVPGLGMVLDLAHKRRDRRPGWTLYWTSPRGAGSRLLPDGPRIVAQLAAVRWLNVVMDRMEDRRDRAERKAHHGA